jgi:ketosteroid isomerase-like protein
VQTENRTYVPNFIITHSEFANTDLEKAQRSFAESLKKDEADAIIDNASDNIRVYRNGQLPAVGKKAAEKMLAEEDAKTTRAPSGTGVAAPVDLAYEYGEYTSNRDKINEHGIYLCIWRLEFDGAWKIALDLQKSAPEKK